MQELTRRSFLGGAVGAALAVCAGSFHRLFGRAAAESGLPAPVIPQGYTYFSTSEVAFLDAAVERLIPSDELGVGARGAGVTFFLDRQMAGPYGRAETWYMQGPWRHGTDEQGYQVPLTPAGVYRHAIAAIDDHCRRGFSNKTYAQLGAAEQDDVLHALQQGRLEIGDVPAKAFFDMLLHNTREGFLADPIYGGNRDFAGWKQIGFPGPRYNYVEEIERYGQPYTLPSVGLLGRERTRSS